MMHLTENKQRFPVRKAALPLLLALLLVLAAACSSLTSVPDNDPHPPVISGLRVTPTTIRTGGSLTVSFNYFDEGADIENVYIRDKHSSNSYEGKPPAEADDDYVLFPGVSGTRTFIFDDVKGSQAGPHTFVIWLEDLEESMSNQLEFTITIYF